MFGFFLVVYFYFFLFLLFFESLHILMTLWAITYLCYRTQACDNLFVYLFVLIGCFFFSLRQLNKYKVYIFRLLLSTYYFSSVSPNVDYLMRWTDVQHWTFPPHRYRWSRPRLLSMFLFAFSIFTWCCCWQIRYHTASMPPEAYWHSGAVHRFSNRLELFQFCCRQIWTDVLPPLFPGCNNSERLIYKTCSTINSWIDFLLGISGAAVF